MAGPSPGAPIPWADPALATALAELRRLPAGAELLEALGCEYLAAAFLVAHGLSPKEALEPIRSTAGWRKTVGAAAVRRRLEAERLEFHDFPHCAQIRAHMPLYEGTLAIDRQGLPYSLRCTGMTDAEGLFSKLTEDQMFEWQLFVNEWRLLRLERAARQTGKLGGVTLLHDLTSPEGLLSMWRKNHGKSGIMRKTTVILDTHYPGVVGKVVLANAPWVIHAILQVLQTFIPARILQKIEVVPEFKTQERLLELVEPAHLPRFLGGGADDEAFVPGRSAMAAGADHGALLEVLAGKSAERGIWLTKGHIAAFGFHVAGGATQDIVFSARFEPETGDPVEVRATSRVKEATGGTFLAPQRGRLVLVFDNSYSWVNAKSLRYECAELPPDATPAAAAGGQP